MLDNVHPSKRSMQTAAFVTAHPWATVALLLPLGIAAMVAIDLALGDRAEYYNAFGLMEAWAHLLTGGSFREAPEFIVNQNGFSAAGAMLLGTALLFVEPAVVLGAIVFPMSLLARGRSSSPNRSQRKAQDMHIHTEIEINAHPADVWDALSDTAGYPAWNPYHVQVQADGVVAPGQRLVVEIHKPNGDQVTIRPHVLRLEPGRELTWGGGPRGIFRGEHTFIVEPTDTGTRLIHSEVFSGFAVRFAHLESIEEGYRGMNLALKRHLEATPPATPRRNADTSSTPHE